VARPRLLNVPRQPDGHDRLHVADLSPNGSGQPRRSAPLGALDGSHREVWWDCGAGLLTVGVIILAMVGQIVVLASCVPPDRGR